MGDAMRMSVFRSLAYVYVAMALAPLVLITIALVVALSRGGDVLLWNVFSAAPREPAVEEQQAKDEQITFRTELLPLSRDRFTPADYYALGVGHVVSGNANTAAPPNMQPSGFGSTQSGQFNNVLILDKQTGQLRKVFDRRMSVSFFGAVDLPAGKALVIFATGNDSNKDGVLSAEDLHSVFVYTPGDAKLHAVTGFAGSAVGLDDATDPGSIIVRAIIDRNKDGSAVVKSAFGPGGVEEEPQAVYKVNLTSFAATPLVPPSMVSDLQSALGARQPKIPADLKALAGQ